jgi:hypothetical protein
MVQFFCRVYSILTTDHDLFLSSLAESRVLEMLNGVQSFKNVFLYGDNFEKVLRFPFVRNLNKIDLRFKSSIIDEDPNLTDALVDWLHFDCVISNLLILCVFLCFSSKMQIVKEIERPSKKDSEWNLKI